MCGRYYIEIEEKELQHIIAEVNKNMKEYPEQMTIKTSGEIFPTDIVPVQIGIHEYQAMKWGFSNFNGKPLINARSETALEKPTFKQAMLKHRCLIPASGYYEWQKSGENKLKYKFFLPGGPIYFAGCYRREQGSLLDNFVILTRQAAKGIINIHNRMPVIIEKRYCATWLHDDVNVLEYAIQELQYAAV